MKYTLLIILVLFINSCDFNKKISPNEEISIKENQKVNFKFDSKPISIQVNNVQDSRCPENVQCVRAGEALATFDISIDGTDYLEEKLCIICEPPLVFPNEKQIGAYIVTLASVSPYPNTLNQIKENTVVFQMR